MNLFKSIASYFRSKERKEQIIDTETFPESTVHLYKKKLHINNTTIVIFEDLDEVIKTLSKIDENKEVYEGLDQARSISDIKDLFIEQDVETTSFMLDKQGKNSLLEWGGFHIVNKSICLKDTKIPIPDLVLAEFIYLVEKVRKEDPDAFYTQYNSLVMFWLKLASSPLSNIESILGFCKNNDVHITKNGNIIAYRRVKKYKIQENEDRTWEYVSSMYKKIKGWKKSPQNYVVCKEASSEQFTLCKFGNVRKDGQEEIGLLGDLFLRGDTSKGVQLYTSSHNRGKYKFPIPGLYKMENEEPNPNLSNCSAEGLHCANVKYNYSGFGDVPVVVLVNPQKTIFVPNADSGKFRTSEMYIACINPNDMGVHINESLIEEADTVYNQITLDQLKEVVNTNSLSSLSVQEYTPKTSLDDIGNIVTLIENRVKKI